MNTQEDYSITEKRYKVAINRIALSGKIESGSPLWAEFNDSFVAQEVTSLEFINAIYNGQAYAAWHNGRRKVDNFQLAQHIAVDMDTEDKRSSIDWLMKHEFVRAYASILYSTPSHTDEAPRSRIIFLLDRPITDGAGYKQAIEYIYSLFPGADPSCVDASRFLYGSKNCRIEWMAENELPLSHLRMLYLQSQQNKPQPTKPRATGQHTGKYSPDKLVEYAVQDAPGRGRNNQGYILARRLRENGVGEDEATNWMLDYQRQVQGGPHKYTEREVITTLRSAYK